ncbi:MAG: hypothetical protein E5Y58_26860 [Mesorhizobium sp.]|nr:MAG: hypothetical protein E5Y58_26860 [Mesorhizobium sp.]
MIAMVFLDPETRFLIKEGIADIRAVNEGRKTLDQTKLPPGTYMERGKVHLPSTGLDAAVTVGAGLGLASGIALAGLGGAMLVVAVRAILVYEVRGVAIYLIASIALAILVMGAILYWLRDVQRILLAGLLQITAALVAGVVAFFSTPDPSGGWIVLIPAVIAIADGIDKLARSARAASSPPDAHT